MWGSLRACAGDNITVELDIYDGPTMLTMMPVQSGDDRPADPSAGHYIFTCIGSRPPSTSSRPASSDDDADGADADDADDPLRSRVTVSSLIRQLDLLVSRHIFNKWQPRASNVITARIERLQKETASLGSPPDVVQVIAAHHPVQL
jgi:hypothetical protein